VLRCYGRTRMAAKSENRMVGATVKPELHRRIRLTAAERDMSISDLLRELLDEEIPEY